MLQFQLCLCQSLWPKQTFGFHALQKVRSTHHPRNPRIRTTLQTQSQANTTRQRQTNTKNKQKQTKNKHTQKQTNKQTNKQTDRQTDRQTSKQASKQTHTHTHTLIHSYTHARMDTMNFLKQESQSRWSNDPTNLRSVDSPVDKVPVIQSVDLIVIHRHIYYIYRDLYINIYIYIQVCIYI